MPGLLGAGLALAMLFVVGAFSSAPAPAQTPQPEPAEEAATSADGYLRPGDVIRLRIWREPDLSDDFMVHEDGVAVFPKIGAFRVDRESPESLREKLVEAYRVYLVNPAIEVTLLRRVNILGAVRNPGLYPVDPTMTIADALALAGGALAHGKPDEVELIRAGRRLTANIQQQTRLQDLPLRSGDQLFVPERHWLARHTGIVATVISASVSLFIALAL